MVRQNKGISVTVDFIFEDGISVTVDFIFEDMRDPELVTIPFSDGHYHWTTCMLTRKEDLDNPDLLLFRNHVLHWMEEIKAGKIQR